MNARTALILTLTTPTLALAQGVHDADFILAIEDGQLVTGAVDPVSGDVVYPQRIKAAQFGAEGIPNFTNDPGFDSELGMLVPGLEVGFSILSAPRVWDDATQDFETIATETFTVRGAGQNFIAPMTDTRVDGVVFGQANNDAGTSFHHHLQYFINGGIPPVVEGVFLLELEVWTTSGSVAPTDPIYIVFAQGAGLAQQDDAVAWVEDTLINTICVPDINGDGVLDFFDVSAFLTAFGQGDASADINDDGVFDFFDVSAFLTAFSQGCP